MGIFLNGSYDMDIQVFAQIVSSVGFPIAACCVMFIQNNKLQDTLKEIAVTMQKMADAIDDLESGKNGN